MSVSEAVSVSASASHRRPHQRRWRHPFHYPNLQLPHCQRRWHRPCPCRWIHPCRQRTRHHPQPHPLHRSSSAPSGAVDFHPPQRPESPCHPDLSPINDLTQLIIGALSDVITTTKQPKTAALAFSWTPIRPPKWRHTMSSIHPDHIYGTTRDPPCRGYNSPSMAKPSRTGWKTIILLDFADDLGLTGSKHGCDVGVRSLHHHSEHRP